MGASVTFGDIFYTLLRPLAWLLTHLVCRYRVSGREYVPLSGPLLVAANHLSWYDPIILALVLPRRGWFFAQMGGVSWAIVGWLFRLTGQVSRPPGGGECAATEESLAYLHEG